MSGFRRKDTAFIYQLSSGRSSYNFYQRNEFDMAKRSPAKSNLPESYPCGFWTVENSNSKSQPDR